MLALISVLHLLSSGCNATFSAKSSWYVHVKKHEQRKDAITYYCPIEGCDRKYKDGTGLRAHLDKCHYNKTESTKKASTLGTILTYTELVKQSFYVSFNAHGSCYLLSYEEHPSDLTFTSSSL